MNCSTCQSFNHQPMQSYYPCDMQYTNNACGCNDYPSRSTGCCGRDNYHNNCRRRHGGGLLNARQERNLLRELFKALKNNNNNIIPDDGGNTPPVLSDLPISDADIRPGAFFTKLSMTEHGYNRGPHQNLNISKQHKRLVIKDIHSTIQPSNIKLSYNPDLKAVIISGVHSPDDPTMIGGSQTFNIRIPEDKLPRKVVLKNSQNEPVIKFNKNDLMNVR